MRIQKNAYEMCLNVSYIFLKLLQAFLLLFMINIVKYMLMKYQT